MIKAWWIRRWYFLYISAFMILHIVALFKPFQFRPNTFYTDNIFSHKHCFTNNIFYTNSFLLGYLFIYASFFYII
ncbi:hypothetical protein HanIR_Chr06g0272091 [Helianthus annuus]|nr:hypothetical protein HanIR_Chr06g0272091 [Helianthus annuus]